MLKPTRTVIATAFAAVALVAGASAAGAQDDYQLQYNTLGQNMQRGGCQTTTQQIIAGLGAGGVADQACEEDSSSCCHTDGSRRRNLQYNTLGQNVQVGGCQTTTQQILAGLGAGGVADQGCQ